MKETLVTESLAVIDDFLEPTTARAMTDLVDQVRLQSVHSQGYAPVWGHCDGNPLRSVEHATVQDPGDYMFFATGLHNLLLEPRFSKIVGKATDWKTFTMQAYHYPQGSQLSWHDDDILYTGSYVYYTHPWSIWYGGELIVMPRFEHLTENMKYRVDALDSSDTIGQVVYPKPNRLVLIQAGIVHKVARVEPYAGMAVRKSIAGFFKKE